MSAMHSATPGYIDDNPDFERRNSTYLKNEEEAVEGA